ncbi:hypothetical protein ZWY2020_011983 [Hordeum vulgare]|nr:hypothetical protein ZWY2020_011983 [Hordeum vulgare]
MADAEEEACMFALQLATSAILPMTLRTCIELGLLETLAAAGGKALTPEEVAAAKQLPSNNSKATTKTNPEAAAMVDRMLRVLAAYKVVSCVVDECDDGSLSRRYGAEPVCKWLTANEDGVSMAPFCLLAQDKLFMEAWCHTKEAVLEGGSAFTRAFGASWFEHAATDARFNRVFNEAMEQHSVIITKKLLELYHGFEGIGTLVDVAGGLGAVIHAITTKYPGIKGINFDRVNWHGSSRGSEWRELVNGLMFLYTDEGCMKMSDHITDAGVADIYVEYNGEQDYADDEDSGSDFVEEELHDLVNNGSEGEPDVVITAEEADVILVPNESGVVTEVIQSPVKHNVRTEDLSQCSQVVNSSQPVVASQSIPPIPEVVENGEDSEDSDDPDYVAS